MRNILKVVFCKSHGEKFEKRMKSLASTTTEFGQTTNNSSCHGKRTLTQASSVSNVVMAISESRSILNEVGLAVIDQKANICFTMQFADTRAFSRTLHQLRLRKPSKIIMPLPSMAPNNPSKLYMAIMDRVNNNELGCDAGDFSASPRRNFDSESGKDYLRKMALAEDLACLQVTIATKEYALAALDGLFHYLDSTGSLNCHQKSLRIVYENFEGIVLLDSSTVRDLELIANLGDPKGHQTLYGCLNRTCTPMGARMLRTSILQPLSDVVAIEKRLDTVQELLNDLSFMGDLKRAIKGLPDVDQLISFIIHVPKQEMVKHTENSVGKVIEVKQMTEALQHLVSLMEPASTELLQAIFQDISDKRLEDIHLLIDQVIHVESVSKSAASLRNQRANAVKPGYNGLLDVARQTFSEVTEDIHQLIREYEDAYQIPLKIRFNTQASGYYLNTSASSVKPEELPEVFINVINRRKQLEFTTLQLLKLNKRVEESMTEILLMSDEIIAELMDQFRANIGVFYKVSESIGLLDLLLALAQYSGNNEVAMIRPEFTDTTAIHQGRHPIRDHFKLYREKFIPNDTFIFSGNNMQIITGPNASGKSTYLRQVALLNLLAQIGCYVPAEYASFRVMDMLLTQLSTDDDLDNHASTLMVEMRQMAYIIENITDSSLVIIDELGRGTSTFDGMGITCALCEQMLKTKAFILLATHFVDLAEVLEVYPNVCNLHLHCEEHLLNDHAGLSFNYRLEEGCTKITKYGLAMARSLNFPDDILIHAAKVSQTVQNRVQAMRQNQTAREIQERRLVVQTVERLRQLKNSGRLQGQELIDYLKELRRPLLEFYQKESQESEVVETIADLDD